MRRLAFLAIGLGVCGCGRGPLFKFPTDCDDTPPAVCDVEAPQSGTPWSVSEPASSTILPECAPTFGCAAADACGPLIVCNPRSMQPADDFRCCSDDPAAPGGALPAYEGRSIDGAPPLFSGRRNDQSVTGVRVRSDGVVDGLIEEAVEGCPVPCNPTWSAADVRQVCGPGRTCCQTRPIASADCIQDPQTGRFRPVTGGDIGTQTDWNAGAHRTHQDPAGVACTGLAAGDQASPVFIDCIRQLGVADQRGLCRDVDDCCVDAQAPTVCDALND